MRHGGSWPEADDQLSAAFDSKRSLADASFTMPVSIAILPVNIRLGCGIASASEFPLSSTSELDNGPTEGK